MPLLNLTENEQQDFDALPGGRYFVEVFDAEDRETKGAEGAKLPAGTPMIWLHLKVLGRVGEDDGPNEESEYYNRRLFRHMVIPPEKIGSKKYEHFKKMNGQIVRMLVAFGYPEEEVVGGGFELDTDELIEKQAIASVKRKRVKGSDPNAEEWENEVSGFRSIDSVDTSTTGSLI